MDFENNYATNPHRKRLWTVSSSKQKKELKVDLKKVIDVIRILPTPVLDDSIF